MDPGRRRSHAPAAAAAAAAEADAAAAAKAAAAVAADLTDGTAAQEAPPSTPATAAPAAKGKKNDLLSAERAHPFIGEVWLSNMTAQIQNTSVQLGYKASFAVALVDHTAATQHSDYDMTFMDQTVSSVILSSSPDPSNLLLELGPYAVARVVISPHSQSLFESS
jgi:hypothetical protein